MATPNVVPRANGEGTLGTSSKKWLKMYTTTGVQVGTDDAAGTVQMSNASNESIIWEGTGVDAHETSLVAINATADRTLSLPDATCTLACVQGASSPTQAIIIAASDETSLLAAGTAKVTFRMPYAFTLTAVRANVNTAPTGSVLTVDINEGGSTILSTKLTIDASEKTSVSAAAAAVISDTSLADDAEMTIDIDGIGSTVAGKGLKIALIGYRT